MSDNISPTTLIAMPVSQLLTRWPSASRVFIDYHLACVGCPLNRFHDPLQVVQIYHLMPHNFFSDLVGAITEQPAQDILFHIPKEDSS